MRGLKDKVVLVTGGAGGIGAATCKRFGEEGARVAVVDINLPAAESVANEITAAGGKAQAFALDLTRQDQVVAGVAAVEAALGPVDVLVNNAGWDKPQPFLATDPEFWAKVLAINLNGNLNTHFAVAGRMAQRGGGRIINIASDAARVGTANEAVYSACKGGLISFTKSIARELARKGVLANCVCPGPTNTPMMASVVGEGPDAEKWKDAMVRGIPLRRIGEPEDYAGMVALLASDDGAFITGQAISISGGLTML